MKTILVAVFALIGLSLLVLLVACDGSKAKVTELEKENQQLKSQNQQLKDIAGPLPASLDKYFPPQAPAPVWLLEMFTLEGAFGGIAVNLQEGDMPAAKKSYEAFKAQWTKMSDMVPEWKSRFPMEPVNSLGQALDSGDPAKVGQAMGQVGQACGSCHVVNLVKAQQKYHWKSFAEVKVTDPVSKQSLAWRDYMLALSGSFGAVQVDLQAGKLDKARQNFQDLSARFKMLPAGCVNCHTTPRTYFVDKSVMDMVDALGQQIQGTPNPQKIEELMGGIGNESCLKCHLVHLPAQNRKQQWEIFAALFK
ncbi:MAG: cytochrome c [Chloroflexi bacterium]|nr:cytochrome c [Chloroflexota bacterium]